MEGVPVVGTLLRLYEEGKATRDPWTRNWPFLWDSPVYVWIITVAYIGGILWGKRFMKDRKPLELSTFMVVYNFTMVATSIYMTVEIILSSYDLGYFESPMCAVYNENTRGNPKEMRLKKVLWIYFFTKIVEIMDTTLMVVRKKFDQVTFLHLYHHASMINIWYWVTTYIPGGQSWFCSMLNSFVHIVMYLYYGLAAIPSLRQKLWWKRYITRLQLVQFVLIFFHTIQTTIFNCDFPRWSQYLLAGYMVSMITLFGNFYIQTYKQRKRNLHKKDDMNGAVKNDTPVNGHLTNGHADGHLKPKSH